MQDTVFRFNNCVLDVERRELLRTGRETDIQPRVFNLLLYLIEHRDRAVGKDELQDAIWAGMVITETALTRAIMKARKAVGDDANRQAVIKTLHGHGYRFIAELSDAPEPATNGGSTPTPYPSLHRYLWSALSAAALVTALAVGWQVYRSRAPSMEQTLAVLPLQNDTGDPDLAWTRLGLMSFVSNLLQDADELSLVPDGSVVSLADSFDWKGDLESERNADLLDRLHRVYGASRVLTMKLQNDGTLLRMNYVLLDDRGDTHRGTMVGDEPTALARGVVQSVFGLLLRRSHLGIDTQQVSDDPFNNEAFARGMSLSLKGRCAEAERYFRVIVEQEPTLVLPRFQLAVCLRILGQPEEAENLLQQVIRDQEKLGDRHGMAESLLALGVLYDETGRSEQAESAQQQALTVAGSLSDSELQARILQNLSIVLENRNDWQGAEQLLDRAILAYQHSGRESLPGGLYSAKANLKMDRGELVEAGLYLAKAIKAFREVGDRRNEARMLNNTGYLRRRQGRLEEAEDYHMQSLAIRQEIGDRVGVGRAWGMLSIIYSARGEPQKAADAASSALDIARETRDRLFEGTSLAQLASAEQAMGQIGAARKDYGQSQAVFDAIQDHMRSLQVELRLARLDLEDGKAGAAADRASKVLADTRGKNLLQPEIEAIELLGDIARSRGDLVAADAEYAKGLEHLSQSTWSSKQNTLMTKLADIRMEQDDLEATAPLIGALSQQAENVGSLVVQARYAYLSGDPTLAASKMERAHALAADGWTESQSKAWALYRKAAGTE